MPNLIGIRKIGRVFRTFIEDKGVDSATGKKGGSGREYSSVKGGDVWAAGSDEGANSFNAFC